MAFVAGSIFITIICPFWLKWVQRYKNEMQGPWDYDDVGEIQADNL